MNIWVGAALLMTGVGVIVDAPEEEFDADKALRSQAIEIGEYALRCAKLELELYKRGSGEVEHKKAKTVRLYDSKGNLELKVEYIPGDYYPPRDFRNEIIQVDAMYEKDGSLCSRLIDGYRHHSLKRHGLVERYRKDGSLSSRTECRFGVRHGKRQTFNADGTVKQTTYYDSDKVVGKPPVRLLDDLGRVKDRVAAKENQIRQLSDQIEMLLKDKQTMVTALNNEISGKDSRIRKLIEVLSKKDERIAELEEKVSKSE